MGCSRLDLVVVAPTEHVRTICLALAQSASGVNFTLFRSDVSLNREVFVESLARSKGLLLVTGVNPAKETEIYAVAGKHVAGPKIILCVQGTVDCELFPDAGPIFNAWDTMQDSMPQVIADIVSTCLGNLRHDYQEQLVDHPELLNLPLY